MIELSQSLVDDLPLEETLLLVTEDVISQFKRPDVWLAQALELSRSAIKRLFESDLIVAGIIDAEQNFQETGGFKLNKMPFVGSALKVFIPPPIPATAQAENIPLQILYEDEHLLFINKPAGMVTHPAPGHYTGTLVNAVLYHCPDIQGIGGVKRPGIVHRLDKGTSGVMVVAKTQACHEALVLLFSGHNIERIYEAIVVGKDLGEHPAVGVLRSTIGRHPTHRQKMAANVRGGKEAITHYKVLQQYHQLLVLELILHTGRTHQIRVHLSSLLKRSIAFDPLYGHPKEHLKRLGLEDHSLWAHYPHPLLHARVLGLVHPITKTPLRFEVPAPSLFSTLLQAQQQVFRKERT